MLWQDLRYAARVLRKNPGFSAIAILTLALGIGANTAIFSVVNTVLLAPLPYPGANRLVILHESSPQFHYQSISYPNFLDWQRMSRSFAGMAAYRNDAYELSGGSRNPMPVYVFGEDVSANFFQVLGVRLLNGPGFSPKEDRQDGQPQVVLSYGLWQSRFGGDRGLVGRSIPLNGQTAQVVGILPQSFWFGNRRNALYTLVGQWMPVQLYNRGDHPGMKAVARLKPGVSLAQAGADLDSIGRVLAQRYPKDDGGNGINALPMKQSLVGDVSANLWLLFGAVGLVLLIACVNVANLLLARASGRRRELAMRAALGAGRGRIVRQLLTESVLLGLCGGALGLGLAAAAVHAAPAIVPAGLPRLHQLAISLPVLLYTLGAAIGSGILFGLVPAWSSGRGDLQRALKDGGRTASTGGQRTQSALAVAEMALALVLLAGAGLLIRTMLRLQSIQPGFNPDHVVTMQFSLAPDILNNGPAIAAALDQMEQRINAVPGVAAAAITSLVPLGGSDSEMSFWRANQAEPAPNRVHSAMQYITGPGYLKTMRIPLLRGRYLNAGDQRGHPVAIVVDTVFANEEYRGQNPLGHHVVLGPFGTGVIVGEVGHVKHWGLASDDTATVREQFYMAVDQVPMQYMTAAGQGVSLVIRTQGDPMTLLPAVRRAIAGPGADQPAYDVYTMNQVIATSYATRRFLMELLAGFAGLALALAAIGVYGVLAYAVAQRTQEVGIRLALGASPDAVVRMMLGRGLLLAGLGAGIGLIGAIAGGKLLASDLYGVHAGDAATLAAAVGVLLAVASLASFIPARRAARVDPTIALRQE
jgi:predicted permease